MATYLISDAYFKEQYPMHKDLDMSKFYSTLLIEQQTSLEEVLGEVLYAWLIANASNTELVQGDRKKLLDQCQLLLVFLTARSLIPLEEKSEENPDYSDRLIRIDEKIAYLKAKLIRLINGSTEEIVDPDTGEVVTNTFSILVLMNVYTGEGSSETDPTFDPEDEYSSAIYYWR